LIYWIVVNIEKSGHEILNDPTSDESTKGICLPCPEYLYISLGCFTYFVLHYSFTFGWQCIW
jgi:hypothetical protein